jgi:hypothetical protein
VLERSAADKRMTGVNNCMPIVVVMKGLTRPDFQKDLRYVLILCDLAVVGYVTYILPLTLNRGLWGKIRVEFVKRIALCKLLQGVAGLHGGHGLALASYISPEYL